MRLCKLGLGILFCGLLDAATIAKVAGGDQPPGGQGQCHFHRQANGRRVRPEQQLVHPRGGDMRAQKNIIYDPLTRGFGQDARDNPF